MIDSKSGDLPTVLRALVVNQRLQIPLSELSFTFVRAGGPGGQNVNKVATKAVMRWPLQASAAIPADVRNRFLQRFAHRVTMGGDVVITSQRYRTRHRNQQDCLDKLRELLRSVAEAPVSRRATRPTAASRRARRHDKHAKSIKKKLRDRRSWERE